jgi:hypothetical protein
MVEFVEINACELVQGNTLKTSLKVAKRLKCVSVNYIMKKILKNKFLVHCRGLNFIKQRPIKGNFVIEIFFKIMQFFQKFIFILPLLIK